MSEPTVGVGHRDARGNPCLRLRVAAPGSAGSGAEIEAIIDTGFTGVLQIPQSVGPSIPPTTHVTVVLADGREVEIPAGLAQATFMGMTRDVLVLLSGSTGATLVGMDFLRQFGLGLMLSEHLGVRLVREELFLDVVEQVQGASDT